MKVTVTATRPETIEFSTPDVTGDQLVRDHLAFFGGSAPTEEKVRIGLLITRYMSAFWGAFPSPEVPATEATPSPDDQEEKA